MEKLSKIKPFYSDVLTVLLILFFSPLFFYKLGQSSLISWDEAWYAEIARNILISRDFLNLTFNSQPYIDHPPAGFWMMALTFLILGINEFTARFPSAVLGLGSMVITYFLGKEFFGRVVGIASAIALPSTFWFLYRARSGNLDIFLTFMFLLTILLSLKATKERKFLIPLSISLSLLFLTKAVVPFTIIPVLIIIFWKNWKYTLNDLKIPLAILIIICGSWFIPQIVKDPDYIRYYFHIGLPGVTSDTSFIQNFNQIKEYLHSGIGKWFWPSLTSIFLSIFFFQKRLLILITFFIIFFLPFIFSDRGRIWHLIPLYPILLLSFFGFAYKVIETFLKKVNHPKWIPAFAGMTVLIISIYYSSIQIKQAWYQFVDIPAFISDEQILSEESAKYPYPLILDDDFLPAAVFYSRKNRVNIISRDEFLPYFKNEETFLMITKQERLDGSKISKDKYQVLKTDRDKILVLKI